MKKIQFDNYFLVRRPYYSFNKLNYFNELYNKSKIEFEKKILEFFNEENVLLGLYIASPEMYENVMGLNDSTFKGDKDKLIKSLYKYLVRMCTRPTPYGTFAGCAFGVFSEDKSEITFNDKKLYESYNRIDTNYIYEITNDILKNNVIKNQLFYHINTSLYRIDNYWRYVEIKLKDKQREYLLNQVKNNIYLEKIIKNFKKEDNKLSKIHEILSSDGFNKTEIENFINLLIESQIIVSELEVTATGEDFLNVLIEKLSSKEGNEAFLKALTQIKFLLSQSNSIESFIEIKNIVNENFTTTKSKDLIQTDIFYNTVNCNISNTDVNILHKDLSEILPLIAYHQNESLSSFKKKFFEKYGEKEVHLLSTIDNEFGIGYGSNVSSRANYMPLINTLSFNIGEPSSKILWDERMNNMISLYRKALIEKKDVIELDLNTLKGKNIHNYIKLPDSYFLFGNLITVKGNLAGENLKLIIQAAGGPSSAKLLGRFCSYNKELETAVKSSISKEESCNPNSIYAEIAHIPEARVGNIIIRPILRKYEIPYLTGSGVDKDHQILPDDLFISIKNGEIFLRSKKLNKRIYPRLSNAHNIHLGLPFYQFLGDLQYDGVANGIGWRWDFLSNQTFLPRVEYKHIILSRAYWNIFRSDFEETISKHKNKTEAVKEILIYLKLPRYLLLDEGSNELTVDTQSQISIQLITDHLIKTGKVKLIENLEANQNNFININEEKYFNEVIFPMSLINHDKIQAPINGDVVQCNGSHIFGDEWLFIKIYCGSKFADKILIKEIRSVLKNMQKNELFEKWFFIRYDDPSEHLRIRFFNNKRTNFWNEILSTLSSKLNSLHKRGIISSIQIDTYEQELERYGHNTINQTETLFFYDSDTIVNVLNIILKAKDEELRWLSALTNVENILNDFGYDDNEKKELMLKLQARFFEEFKVEKINLKRLNSIYRDNTNVIIDALEINSFNSNFETASELNKVKKLFLKRGKRSKKLLQEILKNLVMSKDEYVTSIIHMSLNRTFSSQQRTHELVIYHILKKYYDFKISRKSFHI